MNPFESIDQAGVGRLIGIASKEGHATRPELKLGICGDPSWVEFCHHMAAWTT